MPDPLTVTCVLRGDIERGTGKPSYRWAVGYSETTGSGAIIYPWTTRRECQADARQRGMRARFVNADICLQNESRRR